MATYVVQLWTVIATWLLANKYIYSMSEKYANICCSVLNRRKVNGKIVSHSDKKQIYFFFIEWQIAIAFLLTTSFPNLGGWE